VDGESFAVDRVPALGLEGGSGLSEFGGKISGGHVGVQADSEDGVGAGGGVALEQGAANFFAGEKDVVGPFDLGFEPGGGGDGCADGEGAERGDAAPVLLWYLRAQ